MIPVSVDSAAPQGQPAAGTLLAACPSCKRPAAPGKIACMYCGGALVVPFPAELGLGAWLFVENGNDLPWRA